MDPLPVDEYRDLVARALAEDIGTGDVTSEAAVSATERARGIILAKSSLILAGIDIEAIGSARALLTAERTALNFLQRLSGIATDARRYVDAAAGNIVVLDTRKTTPTFRVLEKYAVRCGGATNHRYRLDDGMLIKDNHKRLAGGIDAVLSRVRAAAVKLPIEVEVETLEELDQALNAGADRILVDNFSPDDLREAVSRCRGRAVVEVSGGVTLDRIPEIAASGADFVSVGALTHSVHAADLSFELERL